jgi:hypothetical protein
MNPMPKPPAPSAASAARKAILQFLRERGASNPRIDLRNRFLTFTYGRNQWKRDVSIQVEHRGANVEGKDLERWLAVDQWLRGAFRLIESESMNFDWLFGPHIVLPGEERAGDDFVAYVREELRPTLAPAPHLVFGALADGPLTPKELAEKLDRSPETLGGVLAELVDAGKVLRLSDPKRYALPEE